MCEKGVFGTFQIVPALVVELFSKPVKAVEWYTSSSMFPVYDSMVKQLFWRFQSEHQVKRPKGMWNTHIHHWTWSESLLWRSNKVLQQVAAFPVVSLPQIPCHQTPWPCHPWGDSPRTPAASHIHTPSPCVTGLIIRSLAARGPEWFKFPFLSHH